MRSSLQQLQKAQHHLYPAMEDRLQGKSRWRGQEVVAQRSTRSTKMNVRNLQDISMLVCLEMRTLGTGFLSPQILSRCSTSVKVLHLLYGHCLCSSNRTQTVLSLPNSSTTLYLIPLMSVCLTDRRLVPRNSTNSI